MGNIKNTDNICNNFACWSIIADKYPLLFKSNSIAIYCLFMNSPLRFEFTNGNFRLYDREYSSEFVFHDIILTPPATSDDFILATFVTHLDHLELDFYHALFEYDIKVINHNPGQNVNIIYRQWQIDKIING